MTPMTSSGAIFGSKISNSLFLYFFWPPKKFSENWRARKILTPFLTPPPSSCEKHFLGGRPHFQKMPWGQLRIGAKFKENRVCRFPRSQNAWILENSIFQAPTGSYTGACVTIGQNEISFQSFLFTSFKKRLKSKFLRL